MVYPQMSDRYRGQRWEGQQNSIDYNEESHTYTQPAVPFVLLFGDM